MKNAAGDSFKWVDVAPERFPGWIDSFARRHGASGSLAVAFGATAVTFTAPDGAVAACHPPFVESFAAPAAGAGQDSADQDSADQASAGQASAGYDGAGYDSAGYDSASQASAGQASADQDSAGQDSAGRASADQAAAVAAIATHARAPRTVGVLLVRLGGYAAGVFAGYPPALADSKVGSRLVYGRSAAGGWSQQRFARRREKQANEALAAAAATVATVFGRWEHEITASSAPAPHPASGVTGPARASRSRSVGDRGSLDAVVLGGDKRAVAELRGDPRLAAYFAIATERFLTVPDPKRAVLDATPKLFTAVRIRLTESAPGDTGGRPPGGSERRARSR